MEKQTKEKVESRKASAKIKEKVVIQESEAKIQKAKSGARVRLQTTVTARLEGVHTWPKLSFISGSPATDNNVSALCQRVV